MQKSHIFTKTNQFSISFHFGINQKFQKSQGVQIGPNIQNQSKTTLKRPISDIQRSRLLV